MSTKESDQEFKDTFDVSEVLAILENTRDLIKKTQVNLAKCPKKRLTRGYLEAKLQSLGSHWATFVKHHQVLLKATTEVERIKIDYFKNDDFGTVDEIMICIQGDIKDLLRKEVGDFVDESQQKANNSTVQDLHVRLPRIEIPKFLGAYEQWTTFHDLFTSLVHNNKSISNVQKLHYLKTSIGGECEALLKHIAVTENNYDQAWLLLKNRYGNKKVIVNTIFKRLFSQNKMATQTANHIKSLLDTTNECLNSLRNNNVTTTSWDPIIIFLLVQKLDPETHKEWEEFAYNNSDEELPTWSDLEKFLESKFRTLELVTQPQTLFRAKIKEKSFVVSTNQAKSCIICNEEHTLSHCKEFSKKSPRERSEFAKQKNLCYNCLSAGHSVFKCRIPVSCRICRRRHHSLLHEPKKAEEKLEIQEKEDLKLTTHFVHKEATILLATALVKVGDDNGNTTILRALIDQGSQASFLTERAAQIIKIKRNMVRGTISGVGSKQTEIRHSAKVKIFPTNNEQFELKIEAYIMPTEITNYLPTKLISINNTWQHLRGLLLADPRYNQPGRIDMLLGAEVCAEIFKGEIIKGPPGSPCAQNTSLGWILFGGVEQSTTSRNITVMHHHLQLNTMLKQMWELQPFEKKALTKEEQTCEEIFRATHTRNSDGRYIVKLPLKNNIPMATQGETREIALRRFKQLQSRFEKNPNLKLEYQEVMKGYKEMNYIERVPETEINKPSVYLPQQIVVRRDKETTKVRVVVDASSKGTNNVSLNDDLMVGPQLQCDMRSLIMRWRLKKIGFLADIQKMYLQVLVAKEDADYQRVLWWGDDIDNNEIKDFRMLRVTFGTASAPYLATKTLQQVADDEGQKSTKARQTIKTDFYMDDLMSGEDSEEEAKSLAKEIVQILQKGGFILQKWASNSLEFLKHFEESQRSSHVNIDTKIDGVMKALGLTWNMGEDVFEYKLKLPGSQKVITKRTILADLQHLFDPLGWVSPSIIAAKMLIQKLWLQGVGWDDPVSAENKREWLNILEGFEDLKDIKVKRWMNVTKKNKRDVTLHGFSDASERAYSAVAYLRAIDKDGEIHVSIVAAKARVAPVKEMSLPRLELCGAVLLSDMLKQIKEALKLESNQIVAWSDSTIVLAWLKGEPNKWQTFVRNRVITILENIECEWYHVKSSDNPADLASRGLPLNELKESQLWWQGPVWLKDQEVQLKKSENVTTNLEMKKVLTATLEGNIQQESLEMKFDKFENLDELLRTITFCKRFLHIKEKKHEIDKTITTNELDEALKTIVKISQEQWFPEEKDRIIQKKPVKTCSTLKTLNPYLDEENILRVGGRLRHSDLQKESKNPMIIHNQSKLTRLIVANAHAKTYHGGIQVMLCYLRTRFWILRAKGLVRSTIHNCLICARQRAVARSQLMGDLPKERVTPARPFSNSGADFAGPFEVLMSRGRGAKTRKAYICIFVCLCTKATHLELVGDLTAEAFIGAFRRFVARRGKCAHMWTDQGRNFVAANKELAEEWKAAQLQIQGDISEVLASEGTQWHFIPAYSPNFGGLWEAGVKSLKYHLKRILTSHLTFEEMSTVLCQVEACLNSRPLSPMDDTDPENLDPLTPGHFLIGEAPIAVPSPDTSNLPISHLSRWQHLQKLVRDFWNKWQYEYLTTLQQRPKWMRKKIEFNVGQIVLIKEMNLPPTKWKLGRIVKQYPGSDGLIRVYDVKSGSSVTKRSISKLCPMPIN